MKFYILFIKTEYKCERYEDELFLFQCLFPCEFRSLLRDLFQ